VAERNLICAQERGGQAHQLGARRVAPLLEPVGVDEQRVAIERPGEEGLQEVSH